MAILFNYKPILAEPASQQKYDIPVFLT